MQKSLFGEYVENKKCKKPPSYSKPNKIWENIQEWNTINDIELYIPLYTICSQLFVLTCNHKLACLNYYIDEENDNKNLYSMMYAEIENTWNLPLKERYNLHKELLEKVINNDSTLEYDEKIIDSEKLTLFNYVDN